VREGRAGEGDVWSLVGGEDSGKETGEWIAGRVRRNWVGAVEDAADTSGAGQWGCVHRMLCIARIDGKSWSLRGKLTLSLEDRKNRQAPKAELAGMFDSDLCGWTYVLAIDHRVDSFLGGVGGSCSRDDDFHTTHTLYHTTEHHPQAAPSHTRHV
jgi:hypothetical protein